MESINSNEIAIINLGSKITFLKLSDMNFLLWRIQIIAVLEGNILEDHIYGEKSIPNKTLKITENNVTIENKNPTYNQ